MKTAQRGIYAFDDFKHSRMYLAKYVKRVIKMILNIKKNIENNTIIFKMMSEIYK